MSRSHLPARVILSAAALTAMLLGTACSESTAPSPSEPAGDSPAQLPADTGSAAGDGSLPSADLGEPPTLIQAAPGDTSTAAFQPSFYSRSSSTYNPTYTLGVGAVRVPAGAVRCVTPFMSLEGLTVAATGGKSVIYRQYVIGEVWFYRHNGRAWVYERGERADVDLPLMGGLVTPVRSLPMAFIGVINGGYYSVKLRLTWHVQLLDRSWVQTAQTTYTFDSLSDYFGGFGAVAGPGYCKMP